MTVGSLLHPRVRTVTGGAALARVTRAMLANDAEALPVVPSNGKVMGLVTSTGLIAYLARAGAPSRRRLDQDGDRGPSGE